MHTSVVVLFVIEPVNPSRVAVATASITLEMFRHQFFKSIPAYSCLGCASIRGPAESHECQMFLFMRSFPSAICHCVSLSRDRKRRISCPELIINTRSVLCVHCKNKMYAILQDSQRCTIEFVLHTDYVCCEFS